MAKELPENTDTYLDSPSEYYTFDKKFWVENPENKDFLRMYNRKGVVFRTINKETELMFKNGFSSDNQAAMQAYKDFDLFNILNYAYKNAAISGKVLIYVNYGDAGDYKDEPPANARAIGFYVLPYAWVYQDIYYNQQVYEHYEIYRADGTTFKIHKNRIIRFSYNDDEVGKILPAYDSLQVLDNVLWGTGQTMFRSGSGFPVVRVKNSNGVVTLPNGTKKTRLQMYKDMGFLRDMNTQTGFLIDEQDTFTFEGAAGKAIQPKEYYEVALQQVAIDLDVPVDVLKGISAGAVTGSETNLKIYYGDLHAKQKDKLEALFNDVFETLGITKVNYKWNPIFEQTQTEISDNLTKDVQAIYELELYGYYTHEQAVDFFARNYPTLNYDDQNINKIKNLPTYIKPAGFNIAPGKDNNSIRLSSSTDEASALPETVQRSEKKYARELNKAFNDTNKQINELLAAFNTE